MKGKAVYILTWQLQSLIKYCPTIIDFVQNGISFHQTILCEVPFWFSTTLSPIQWNSLFKLKESSPNRSSLQRNAPIILKWKSKITITAAFLILYTQAQKRLEVAVIVYEDIKAVVTKFKKKSVIGHHSKWKCQQSHGASKEDLP